MSSSLNTTDSVPRLMSSIDGLSYFYEVDYYKYSIFFNEFILNDSLPDADSNYRFLLKKRQFYTYELKHDDLVYGRIGFKNLNTKDNLFSIYIQLDATAIHVLGIDVVVEFFHDDLISKGLCPVRSMLSKVDINAFVANYDFSNIKREHMKTRAKYSKSVSSLVSDNNSSEYYFSGGIETIYFGKKGGQVVLKIYDKIKEMFANNTFLKDSAIRAYFMSRYGRDYKIKSLWNVEFMLNREGLKSFKLETLEDLWENANSLFYDLMLRYDYLDYTKTNDKTVTRIPSMPIWEYIRDNYKFNYEDTQKMERTKKRVYQKDAIWLKNRVDEFYESIIDGYEVDLDELESSIKLLSSIRDEILNKTSFVQK